jgi:hypothetical protein
MVMRRYCEWAGNPKGNPEDPKRCIVEVSETGRSMLSHQCYRKRGYGPEEEFCKQHAKMWEEGRHLYIPTPKELL